MENYKVAAVTDDGITISQHFGRAMYYEVLSIENSKVVKRERREKMGHHNFAQEEHAHSNGQHGFDESSHNKHVSMAEAIKDCKYLLARGMGAGAYQSMLQLNINPVVTDIRTIDDAVKAIINGTIIDHTEKLH
ncbi:MAG: NifB/NifX family molybdenum-iron cluster-binding protein [Ignavibacteriaceae bacterium]